MNIWINGEKYPESFSNENEVLNMFGNIRRLYGYGVQLPFA